MVFWSVGDATIELGWYNWWCTVRVQGLSHVVAWSVGRLGVMAAFSNGCMAECFEHVAPLPLAILGWCKVYEDGCWKCETCRGGTTIFW